MKVIKKNGDIQEFNKEKISISIYNASCDTEYGFLNSSDLKVILDDILITLYSIRENDRYTSSYTADVSYAMFWKLYSAISTLVPLIMFYRGITGKYRVKIEVVKSEPAMGIAKISKGE